MGVGSVGVRAVPQRAPPPPGAATATRGPGDAPVAAAEGLAALEERRAVVEHAGVDVQVDVRVRDEADFERNEESCATSERVSASLRPKSGWYCSGMTVY